MAFDRGERKSGAHAVDSGSGATSETTPHRLDATSEMKISLAGSLPSYQHDLASLFELTASRGLASAIDLISASHRKLWEAYEPTPIPFSKDGTRIDVDKPTQFGDLVYIPRMNGRAFVVSDLEGDLETLQGIFEKHKLVEAMQRNDPANQVLFIMTGDAINRGVGGSQIYEFLMDLKYSRGCESNILCIPGNHELTPSVQMTRARDLYGEKPLGEHEVLWQHEILFRRPSYATQNDLRNDIISRAVEWHYETFPNHGWKGEYSARAALWRLFNEMFKLLPKQIVTENGFVLCHAGPAFRGPFAGLTNPNDSSRPKFQEAFTWLANRQVAPADSNDPQEEILHDLATGDLTWSDWSSEIEMTAPNPDRGTDILGNSRLFFGQTALENYLEVWGARCMIRGHQRFINASNVTPLHPNAWCGSDSLLTIDSVVPHRGGISRGYLEIDLGKPANSVRDVKIHSL